MTIPNRANGPGFFHGKTVQASYQESRIPEHQGNPFLEALTPIYLTDNDVINALGARPRYQQDQRDLPDRLRFHLTQTVNRLFHPFPIIRTIIAAMRARKNCSKSWHGSLLCKAWGCWSWMSCNGSVSPKAVVPRRCWSLPVQEVSLDKVGLLRSMAPEAARDQEPELEHVRRAAVMLHSVPLIPRPEYAGAAPARRSDHETGRPVPQSAPTDQESLAGYCPLHLQKQTLPAEELFARRACLPSMV